MMRPVIVRFACRPDAVVRRRCEQQGQGVGNGQVKTFTFRGYLCRLVGEAQICRATVIDMPVRLWGFRGPVWRSGVQAPSGYTIAGARKDYAKARVMDDEPLIRDQWLSAKFASKYFVAASYGAIGGSAMAGSVVPAKDGAGIVRPSVRVVYDSALPTAGHDAFFLGCDAMRFQLSIELMYGRRLSAVFDDRWLSSVLAQNISLITAYGSTTPEGSMPSPFPPAPNEEYHRPRWQSPVPRQVAMPAADWIDDEGGKRVFMLTQAAKDMPEHQFILADAFGDIPRWTALQYPYGKAAKAMLALMILTPVPVPFKSDGTVDVDQIPADCELGYWTIDSVPEWAGPKNPPPATNSHYLDVTEVFEVYSHLWPAHFRPSTQVPALTLSIGPAVDADGFNPPTFHDLSGVDCYQSCVIGAIHSTILDGEIEYIMAVRASDLHLMPITSDLRFDDPVGIGDNDVARVKVTKTGLMTVRYRMDDGSVVVDSLFEDVIGSSLCPWFDAEGMDQQTAYCPQVLWGGVVAGKRCYAVRVLRYQRSRYLGSLMQLISLNVRRSENYQGDFPVAGYPGFLTDKGFGPYIDQAQPEEFWWVVDGKIKRVELPPEYVSSPRPKVQSPAINGQVSLGQYVSLIYSSMGIMSGDNSEKWQQYAMEEYLASNTLMQLFTHVSDIRVVYLVLPENAEHGDLLLMAFDGEEVVEYGSVSAPWTQGEHYEKSQHSEPVYALTCYQREVPLNDGEVEPASLILTVTSGPLGYALITRDGGKSWEPLVSAPDSFEEDRSVGIPGHGYLFTGTALWKPAPFYPFTKKEAADGRV